MSNPPEEALKAAAIALIAAVDQDSLGRWIIMGDGEVLASDLAQAIAALPRSGEVERLREEYAFARERLLIVATEKLAAEARAEALEAENERLREVTPEMERAALESVAVDDEGAFPCLLDLLDFSGENKAHTIIRAALHAALAVKGVGRG